jgi:uncharacterized protein YndB with AHSA1/START domain
MSQHSAQHATFVIERQFDFPPALVFKAWADPGAKARWFVGPEEWVKSAHRLDFRVGGKESVSGGPKGGPVHAYDATYYDIVPNRRFVIAYDMHLGEQRISVSLATVEFAAAGGGTRLKYTEQGVFLDGYDDAGSRERGTQGLLDQLDAALRKM